MEGEGWGATPPFSTEREVRSKVPVLTLAKLVVPLTPQFLLLGSGHSDCLDYSESGDTCMPAPTWHPLGAGDKAPGGINCLADSSPPTFSTRPEDICTALNETDKTQKMNQPRFPVAIYNTSMPAQSPSCFFWGSCLVYRGESTRMKIPRVHASAPIATWDKQRRNPGRGREGDVSPGEPSGFITQSHGGCWSTYRAPGMESVSPCALYSLHGLSPSPDNGLA